MKPCPTCKTSGANWLQCAKCGKVICKKCASKGQGGYPLMKVGNKCPYCGKMNCLRPVR